MISTKMPDDWEKYKLRTWSKAALSDPDFRREAAAMLLARGSEVRHDSAENFLADLKKEEIPWTFK